MLKRSKRKRPIAEAGPLKRFAMYVRRMARDYKIGFAFFFMPAEYLIKLSAVAEIELEEYAGGFSWSSLTPLAGNTREDHSRGKEKTPSRWSEDIAFHSFAVTHLRSGYEDRDTFGDRSDRLCFEFTFQNLTDKTITALRFRARFYNAYGDILHEHSFDADLVLHGGEIASPNTSWYFRKGRAIPEQVYSVLIGPASTRALRMAISVESIAFRDGAVHHFKRRDWSEPVADIAEQLGRSNGVRSLAFTSKEAAF